MATYGVRLLSRHIHHIICSGVESVAYEKRACCFLLTRATYVVDTHHSSTTSSDPVSSRRRISIINSIRRRSCSHSSRSSSTCGKRSLPERRHSTRTARCRSPP
jgi:hypothetical protein